MRGHIRKRGRESWAIILDLGVDADGKRRQKWHSVRGTRADAERERARLVHELNTGAYVEPQRLTLAQFLRQWLRDYAKVKVSPKTYERYEEIVTQHLIPALGHHPVLKLHPLHIQAYYSKALSEGRKDGKGGLSAQTVLHHHRVLRQALQQGLRWRLLARNPADAVEPPRPTKGIVRSMTDAETKALLSMRPSEALYVPVLLALSTGMRRGELLGVRWDDVDLDAGSLSVTQTLEQTRGGLRFKEPKTQQGRRVVALGAIAVDVLRRHRVQQAEQKLRLGPAYDDQGLVFPGTDGRPWKPDRFSYEFSALAARLGVARVRFHDLRHTHATDLLKEGVHPKIVSERLGHSTIGITLDTYTHVMPGMQEEAARKSDAALAEVLKEIEAV